MMNFYKLWRLLAAACTLAAVAAAQHDLNMEVSGFRVPEYDEQGVMTSQIFGDRAVMQRGGEVKITGLRMEFYKNGKTEMTVTSPYCFYNQNTRDAHSDAPIAADMQRMTLRGRGFILKSNESTVRIFDDTVVTIKDVMQQVSGKPAASEGTNVTVITSKEMFLEYKERKAHFERNVHVKDSKMEMFCDELEIQAGEDNQIDWIGAYNGVRILSDGREALAGNAMYHAKNGEFVLQDSPKVVDGRNVLAGNEIRFWKGSRRMVCEPARLVVYSGDKLQGGLLKNGIFEK